MNLLFIKMKNNKINRFYKQTKVIKLKLKNNSLIEIKKIK